jgi:predicted AAA+ superfamily ATPase
MQRLYHAILKEHLQSNRQMAFLPGPRQVGKTTSAKTVASPGTNTYFNWDIQASRHHIVQGPDAVADNAGLQTLQQVLPIIVFDEIHKYGKWKTFLKGFFDSYADTCRIIVTGSGRLDIYKRGGDSLMGRYFLYRMHPLSVAELLTPSLIESEIRPPRKIDPDTFSTLLQFGGFPEPFLAANTRFYNRWRRLRSDLLFREDLRDLTRVQEMGQLRMLAEILEHQAGQLVNYSTLANQINVSVDTIRRWIAALESLYYCFTVRPWFRNIRKSLRKQPKVFLWDWSLVGDQGARYENFVASHLLKAVHWWTDIGLGSYGLYYVRDKAKREVDFLVIRNEKPWFLVEVKSSAQTSLNKNLFYFQKETEADHAFQLVFSSDYIAKDCFSVNTPVQVPVLTFLSQLV